MEVHKPGISLVLKQLSVDNIENVRIVRGDALQLLNNKCEVKYDQHNQCTYTHTHIRVFTPRAITLHHVTSRAVVPHVPSRYITLHHVQSSSHHVPLYDVNPLT
eukprot:797864-Amorphochlora_amoeboformis.AAC.1